MECLNCGKKLVNTRGKRPKKFCNTSCRSSYGQKKKKAKAGPSLKKPGRPKKSAIEPFSDEVLKAIVVTTTPKVFDSPKVDTLADEPKKWQEGDQNLPYMFTPTVIYDVNGKAMTEEEIDAAMNALGDHPLNRSHLWEGLKPGEKRVINPDGNLTEYFVPVNQPKMDEFGSVIEPIAKPVFPFITDNEGKVIDVGEELMYPSDYNELLRVAKAGVNNQVAFRKHVEDTKLTPGQRGMIYSKLKKDIPKL